MKLLLTSSGITNQSIAKALFELAGKNPEDTSLVFIPTASNIETGDKSWLINDLNNLYKLNLKSISITDISAVPENIWRPQIEEADVIFFEGGNTYYLMEWVNKSGLADLLPELLKIKVYVGVSAGSMITNPNLNIEISKLIYNEDLEKDSDIPALNYTDFYFLPHLNNSYFSLAREENIKNIADTIQKKVYALDDNSALKIIDGEVEIISEGEYLEYN
ncbi:MAG: Type 1 glutamine amidotransferase-like domain-containing protein [Candidatus Nomurabacteria bacterium]